MENKTKKIIQAAVTIAVVLAFMMPVSATFAYKDDTECLSVATNSSILLENESNMVELNGTIKAEWVKDDALRSQWLGLISPSINLSKNQTLYFDLTNETEENGTIHVNKTLRIEVEVIGEPERDFLFDRYLTTAISIIRQEKSIRILKNWWWLGKILTITRTSLISSEEALYIELPLQYTISNTTASEKFHMHIFAWGMLPGNVYPGVDILPVVDYGKLNVDIIYEV